MNRLDKEIADALAEEDEALLALSEGPEHAFSPDFEAALDDLFRQARRQPVRRRRNLWRGLLTAAVVAVMLAGTLAATADYWFDGLKSFFVTEHNEYKQAGQVQRPISAYEGVDAPPAVELINHWYPKYLPEGYSLESVLSCDNQTKIYFSAGEGTSLVLIQQARTDETLLDSKGGTPEITINDFSAETIEKVVDDILIRTVSWASDDSLFTLTGYDITFDELIRIGESLVFAKE